MFDKIQSTYFKRVTTGVLALFMTASSGFSYAVPVYAEEVTTAAAKRKKEEEFSSTESSTLQLNENSTKEEVKNNQDTGNDDVKVTTNGSSEDQPEVTYEKPDTKEPGRKLSSEEAQKDLKKIIEGKKYSYEAILQRIFEIDDFSFYSSLTSDDIKFLMSGKTEEKYEILEILKLKSVNYYDYNSLSPKKFYLSLFSYFKLIDQCDEELSKDVKKQIQDQVLKDINQFYIKEESQYYENINDFYVNDMQDFENVSKEDGAKYVDAISTYIYTKSDERDKNVIRKALDLEEVDEETDEKELEDWATNNKDGSFTIKDHLDSLKGTEESYNQGGDYGYSTNNYFYVTIHDNDGNDTNATINITGRSSKYGNKDKALYQRMLKNETTWNCSMTINGANNHNLGLTHNTVTTKQDKFKGTDGKYAWFVMNFKISYTRHAYYYNKGCSYDKNDKDIRFNTKNYTLQNTGDDGNSIEKGYTSYDKPVTANIQINTGHTGTRTFKHYRYRGGRVTINYTREKHTIRYDANGGSGAPGNQTKTMGVDLWLSSTTPSRPQYVFKGWNTEANGSGTSYSPGQQFYPDADTTLYAQWEEDTSYQYLDVNGVLDGNQAYNTDGMGKFDVYIDGQLVSDPAGSIDFYDKYKVGSKYEIKNIRPNSGISYDHASPGLSGTITGYTSVDLYFYAQWTPWKHVLHYNKNVPTSSTSQTVSNMPVDQTKTFGQLMTISNLVPTRKGYTFAGWYTQSNGTGTKYDPGSNYAADQDGGTVNLYAKWTPWTYNIKYDQNVKSTSSSKTVTDMPAAQTKTQEIDVTLSSMTPKRNGYIFAGWSTSANGSVEYKPGSRFTKDLDSNGASITLYAVWTPWKHTVTYDKNVPADSKKTDVKNMPGNQTKIYDQNLTLQSNVPTRTGYTFVKWTTNKDGTGTAYQPGSQYSYNRDSDGGTVTLYAVWTPWKYTVRYDKNVPASSSSQTVSNMPADQTKTEEVNLTLSSNKPSRNGYIFNGWQAQINGKAVDYQPGATLSYDPDVKGSVITLKAKWTAWKHTIHYDKNVPASSSSQTVANMPEDDTKTFDITKTISSTKPSRNGYIFNGWNTQKNGKGTAYASGAEYKHDQNGNTVTLYAQWTAWKHTVHYNANGGDQNSVPTDQTKTFDQAMILSDKKPTRHGYNFVRWNTKADGPGTSYEVKGNYNHDQNGGTVTLYAIWTPWVHTVHYDANGGDQSSVPNDQKKTYGQSMNVATKVPTRNEYKFLGWTTGKDGSGTFYNPGDAYYHDQNGQTVTLYAKWIQLYTVKYDGNQPAIKGVTVTGSVANQTQGQDESVNLRTNNFKNNSGIYKDWSVGKDAYKYAKQDGKIREFIHPEGFKTNHSTMQTELYDYTGGIACQ